MSVITYTFIRLEPLSKNLYEYTLTTKENLDTLIKNLFKMLDESDDDTFAIIAKWYTVIIPQIMFETLERYVYNFLNNLSWKPYNGKLLEINKKKFLLIDAKKNKSKNK